MILQLYLEYGPLILVVIVGPAAGLRCIPDEEVLTVRGGRLLLDNGTDQRPLWNPRRLEHQGSVQ